MDYYEEIYHHGILGQKWGVRRFQNKDGSLTKAGEERYSSGKGELTSAAQAKQEEAAESRIVANSVKEARSGKPKSDQAKIAKDIYKIVPETKEEKTPFFKQKVQQHKDNLYKKYRQYGCTDKEARSLVEDQIKKERTLAISAGLLAVGVAGIAVYNHIQNGKTLNEGKAFLDDTLLDFSDTPLHRISTSDNITAGHAFYASFEKMDARKYRYGYGFQQMMQGNANSIYDLTMNTNQKVNLAGRKTAEKVLFDLLKTDKDFREACSLNNSPFIVSPFMPIRTKIRAARWDLLLNGDKSIDKLTEKQRSDFYEMFNVGLINHLSGDKAQSTFYSKLKEMGYHAIEDVNDQKFSGYRAKHPLIVFDSSVVSNVSAEKVSPAEILAGKLWFDVKVATHG